MIKLILLLFTTIAFAAPDSNVERQYRPWNNLLKNPGVENGRVGFGASTAAHLTVSTTAAQVASGSRALAYDAAADNDQMYSVAVAVPNALKGRNCLGKILYINGDANVDFQVTDGTNTLASNTLATVSTHTASYVSFICPSSGNIRLEVEATADAAAIQVDDMYLGENYQVSQITQAVEYGKTVITPNTSCVWQSTSASLANLGADSDCNTPTNTGNANTVNKKPSITFDSLPPGRYMVVINAAMTTSGTVNCETVVTDGTSTSGYQRHDNAVGSLQGTITGFFSYTTGQGGTTFELQNKRTSGAGTCEITDATSPETFEATVYKFPSSTETVYTPDTTGWYVEATITGTNPDLTNATVGTETSVSSAGLTMVKKNSSLAVEIPCSSTNASSGLTCSAGDEVIGVVYTQPKAGLVEACVNFTHIAQTEATAVLHDTFRFHATSNTAQTATTSGNNYVNSGMQTGAIGAGAFPTHPHKLCNLFEFTSAGEKTLRLQYKQTVSGSVTASYVATDGTQERNAYITVRPVSEHVPQPLIMNHVSTTANSGMIVNSVTVINSGGAHTTTEETGDWISSIADTAAGTSTITLTSGVYPNKPNCFCTVQDGATGDVGRMCSIASAETTSTVVVEVFSNGKFSTSADPGLVDNLYNLTCIGAK